MEKRSSVDGIACLRSTCACHSMDLKETTKLVVILIWRLINTQFVSNGMAAGQPPVDTDKWNPKHDIICNNKYISMELSTSIWLHCAESEWNAAVDRQTDRRTIVDEYCYYFYVIGHETRRIGMSRENIKIPRFGPERTGTVLNAEVEWNHSQKQRNV